ncbi:hypothetical protein BKA62DRAFT_697076 [Auriculariales sp. MPI-PUGE-AT-0066]|nr:hypothetical protein BKA62DRAFT_697076 [Auriculariales sp. MPI-PUGE-AT-0066]
MAELDRGVARQSRIAEATQAKDRGNARFKAGDWPGAVGEYIAGLAALPMRPRTRVAVAGTGTDADADTDTASAAAVEDEEDVMSTTDKGKARADGERPREKEEAAAAAAPVEKPHELDNQDNGNDDTSNDPAVCMLRAVLHANVAACRAKQGEHKLVVESCTEALVDDPKYTKALFRRAQANEALDTWSSLEAANKDYDTLLSNVDESSPDARNAKKAQRLLAPRLEEAKKKEMDEMMGKLKGLGNSVLGYFGLSTNNFQFTPNEQGGYAMNFVNS